MPRGSKTPAPRLKLVIRRLPPTLPEETFWRVVEPYVEGKSVWRRYVKGRAGDAFGAHPQHSRAYVLMSDTESLIAFHAGFDGHLFRSKTGDEFQAVVEYAPIEKTPYKAKAKKDNREGTIDDDPDYLSFLESRGAVETKPPLEVSTPAPQPTSTPLLEALRASANKSRAKAAKKKEKAAAKKEEKESKADAKDNKARAAALASISEAASKRAPKSAGAGGVVMVAGKGREVFVAPADSMAVAESSNDSKKAPAKKKKPRNKKGKDKDEGGQGQGQAQTQEGAGPSQPKKEKEKKGGGGGGGGTKPGGEGEASAVVDETSTDSKRSRNRNRNRKQAQPEGASGAGATGEETSRGGGKGKARGQAQPVAVLNRPDAPSTGSGSATTPAARRPRQPLPTEARIDM